MMYMFSDCSSLTSLGFPASLDTSSVTDMRNMFADCKALTSLELPAPFDTSLVNSRSARARVPRAAWGRGRSPPASTA